MRPTTVRQYQKEEHPLIANRIISAKITISKLLRAVMADKIDSRKHVESFRRDLERFHEVPEFMKCKNLGKLLITSLSLVVQKVKL